jgi:hypothetical protein
MTIDGIILVALGIFIGTNLGFLIAALMRANDYDDMSY